MSFGILPVVVGVWGPRPGDSLTECLLTPGRCPCVPREFFAAKPAQSLTTSTGHRKNTFIFCVA